MHHNTNFLFSSLIIETIKNEVKGRSDMACIYCYPQKEEDAQSPTRIWVTLLAQLLQQDPTVISKNLLSRFNASLHNSTLHANEYRDLFNSQAETFKTVYLIFDDPNSYFSQKENMLQEFWETLEKLPVNVKMLLTFRDRELATHLQASYHLEIKPKEEDLVKYVNGWLKRDTNLSQLLKKPEDRDRVIGTVIGLALKSGMLVYKYRLEVWATLTVFRFLLAKLHMEDLNKCCTLALVKDALRGLPKSVETAFEASFKQISKSEQFDVDLAKHVLTWIAYAKVSLSVDQVLESFALHRSTGEHYRDSRPIRKRLISAGAGLIVVDSDDNIVRLVHESAKDQLHKKNILYKNADLVIAKTCLVCLLRATNGPGIDEKKSLLSYAANYWGSHLGTKYKIADEEAKKLIGKFLTSSTKLIRAFRAMPNNLDSGLRGMTGIHAVVYFDLRSYIKGLVESRVNINAQCVDGQTALHWAVRLRRGHLLKELLANSADINIQDKEKRTALHRALMLPEADCVRIVKRLLRGGAKTDIPDAKGLTALSSTIKYGPTIIAEMLLKKLEDVNAEISTGYNSLGEIFHFDYKKEILGSSDNSLGQLDHAVDEHVKYLINVVLSRGIDLNRPTTGSWLPLIHAVQTQNPSRVKLLLERVPHPANVNLKDPMNKLSPLRWALGYHTQLDILRLLIKHGADVNEKSSDGWTPLISAVRSKENRENKVWLLLEAGAEPDIPDNNNWTALLHAVDGYHEDNSYKNIIWLLISHKADVRVHNNKAFDLAMEHHNLSLAWLLLEHGADPNVADEKGLTPLHRASSSDDVNRVKDVSLLLHWGADASRQDKTHSYTPLHMAVQKSLDNVVVQLAQQTEHLEITDTSGYTALMLAILYPSISIVRILLKNQASCATRDPLGMTAIQHAAFLGFNDALEQMIHSISDPNDINLKDNMGYTALHHALSNGKANDQTIRTLVKGGADLRAEENKGAMTPLMLAVHLDEESFVSVLIEERVDVRARNSRGLTVMHLLNRKTPKGIRSSIEKAMSRASQKDYRHGRGTLARQR
jgi:ankyrin repeat protein